MKATIMLITCSLLTAVVGFSDHFARDSTEKAFVFAAADGGMLEVKLGQLALKTATKPISQNYGKMMATDHAKVNNELKALARKKQILLPEKLSVEKQNMYDSLAAMSGEKFDMLYMNMMIASHEETIGLFQTESGSGQDPDLKEWAGSKIPTLKHHLEMAKALFHGGSKGTGK